MPVLSRQQTRVKSALDNLLKQHDERVSLNADPLQMAHRYSLPTDQEIAAIFSAQLAYGRVSLFLPVLERLMDIFDSVGGPRKWVETLTPTLTEQIQSISYRWNKPLDFLLMGLTLQAALQEHDRIGAIFEAEYCAEEPDLRMCLDRSINKLQDYSVIAGMQIQSSWTNYKLLPASFRRFLARPSGGSACKRWHLLMRWMVRPHFPDLGLWQLPANKLLMPIDVHIHRLSGFLGLLTRQSVDDKSVVELTTQLKMLRPNDPTSYDFALSHLGISGQCQASYIDSICPQCPLCSVCIHNP